MRLGPAANVARLNVDETITALWTFTNALGLLTDVIGERSVGVGVTIDGLLVRDSGIPQAAVTAHEAALAILETQITDGTLLARLAAAEVITALWAFSHANGLQTDNIVERTAAAGVTIDGAQLLDGGLISQGLGAAGSVAVLLAVTGDAVQRFLQTADGGMAWGDGALARDTNLFRAAADELATDDDLNVGGALDLGGDLELSEATTAVVATPINDFATGTATVQRVSTTVILTITGFAGGRSGRLMLFTKFAPIADISFTHEDVNSVAANRIRTPGGVTFILTSNNGLWFWYDNTLARWILIAPST